MALFFLECQLQGEAIREDLSKNEGFHEKEGLPLSVAVTVTRVVEDSRGVKAGVKAGDIITHYDGQKVTSLARLQSLTRIAGDSPRELRLLRDGQPKTLEVPAGLLGVVPEDRVVPRTPGD